MSRLYSYVVVRDYGFAPNPFSGYCTLATCKPKIRAKAQVGDWVVGVGAASKARSGVLIYAMRVSEAHSYDDYWVDSRFQSKRPVLNGSLKRAYGDNIYHRVGGQWIQENSHHSHADGSFNGENMRRDLGADRVLVAEEFYYFGNKGLLVPHSVRKLGRHDICRPGRGHIVNLPQRLTDGFVQWLKDVSSPGIHGEPTDWRGML